MKVTDNQTITGNRKMARYQKKTIRKAPFWLRNTMKIANDLDTQLNRLRKEIEVGMEVAKEIAETREQNAILSHQLSKRNASEATSVDAVLTSGEPEEELPDFSLPAVTGNEVCWCWSWPNMGPKERNQQIGLRGRHLDSCPKRPDLKK